MFAQIRAAGLPLRTFAVTAATLTLALFLTLALAQSVDAAAPAQRQGPGSGMGNMAGVGMTATYPISASMTMSDMGAMMTQMGQMMTQMGEMMSAMPMTGTMSMDDMGKMMGMMGMMGMMQMQMGQMQSMMAGGMMAGDMGMMGKGMGMMAGMMGEGMMSGGMMGDKPAATPVAPTATATPTVTATPVATETIPAPTATPEPAAAATAAPVDHSGHAAPVMAHAPQKAVAGAITVEVTPLATDDVLDVAFAVTLDTHSVDLSFDLAERATLTIGTAKFSATAWEPETPGGHHVPGVLRFVIDHPAHAQLFDVNEVTLELHDLDGQLVALNFPLAAN